jgi:predicted nucleotidyltransferase
MDQFNASALVEPSDPAVREFYIDCLRALDEAGLKYVVGGGYAMAYYTGIRRPTKDLDIFVKPEDHRKIMQVLGERGYRTEYFYPFWIAKALQGEAFIDILYNSGNGLCCVDDDWIDNAEEMDVLGYRTRLIPPEEQLWSKAFVQDRDRYDGADVAHLILSRGDRFDWARLIRRFIGHERVLLSHLILFGYVYPSERERIPQWVMKHLLESMQNEPPGAKVCRGTNIAQKGYLADVHELGFADGRLKPHGPLTISELHQLPES